MVQIVASIGIRSPTFQPKRSASALPAIAPVLVESQERFSSGSRMYSGNISRKGSGSTGIWAKKFLGSW